MVWEFTALLPLCALSQFLAGSSTRKVARAPAAKAAPVLSSTSPAWDTVWDLSRSNRGKAHNILTCGARRRCGLSPRPRWESSENTGTWYR